MRFFNAFVLVASLASAVRLDRRGRVDYSGYRVYRVNTPPDDYSFDSKIKEYAGFEINRNRQYYDVAIPEESIREFKNLDVSYEVLSEDLGADISQEGDLARYPG
jgi:hypothetical protein